MLCFLLPCFIIISDTNMHGPKSSKDPEIIVLGLLGPFREIFQSRLHEYELFIYPSVAQLNKMKESDYSKLHLSGL